MGPLSKIIFLSPRHLVIFQLETVGKSYGGRGEGKEEGGTAPMWTSITVHIETWKEKEI